MKKLKLIMLVCSLLMLTACNQAEENSVPAEESSAESTSAVTETESETIPETVLTDTIRMETITEETIPEIVIPTDEIIIETETIAVITTLPPEITANLESATIPDITQEETSAPEETPVQEVPDAETITETAVSSENAFSGTLWAGMDENGSAKGMIFSSDTVITLGTDADGGLIRTEYEWSADAGEMYFFQNGAVSSANGWKLSEDDTQLTFTDKGNGAVITFYAVDGSTEEEVIAVMDALASMQ